VSEIVKPRQAATVILLRETELQGFEVFLTRRPDGMPFLGGMYCFPGGAVTRDDCMPRMTERCRGLTPEQARKIAGAQLSPRQALGFWVAAARELFEEVGILLAVSSSGTAILPGDICEKHRARTSTFLSLLQQEDLYCDLSSLVYFSHWQTPAQNAMRFDTRFFIAPLPRQQTPLETSKEVTHSIWLSPDLAIQRFGRGELPMIFPTFASLRTLADFESVQSVIKEFSK
jgi:8-oxo-dGTP pyrophosphatase MutT (NUDIX family)